MSTGGEMPQSAADQVQQGIAAQELQNYAKTELPALGYELQSEKQNEPGLEQMAAGQASGSARESEANALASNTANAGSREVVGSGSNIARTAGILTKGAGMIGEASAGGRVSQQGADIQKKLGIIGQGNQLLSQANKALVTAGGVNDTVDAANRQAAAQRQSEASSLGTLALLALA